MRRCRISKGSIFGKRNDEFGDFLTEKEHISCLLNLGFCFLGGMLQSKKH